MSDVKRFYCTRIEDTGGMRGPTAFHAVTASLPDPALRAQVREVDPATELRAWAEKGPDDTIPPEYTPPAS